MVIHLRKLVMMLLLEGEKPRFLIPQKGNNYRPMTSNWRNENRREPRYVGISNWRNETRSDTRNEPSHFTTNYNRGQNGHVPSTSSQNGYNPNNYNNSPGYGRYGQNGYNNTTGAIKRTYNSGRHKK